MKFPKPFFRSAKAAWYDYEAVEPGRLLRREQSDVPAGLVVEAVMPQKA